MADISKITLPNGSSYNIKDVYARQSHDPIPLETKTYTNVIATANDANGAGFFFLKYRGDTYDSKWHIKVRIHATVPGQHLYDTETIYDLWGYQSTYSWFACLNRIKNTSYRPIYYTSHFRVSATGYNNNCGGWMGFNLTSSTNPTNTSYKRTIVVDLLEYTGCSVEMQNTLVTPTNIPNRAAHTDWYGSTNTSYDNFDAANYGLKQTGDNNTTSIVNLYHSAGNYIADSAIYRYQLLFQKSENVLTPLNNVNNSTATNKAMLTNVEFDAFGGIYYYVSTTTVNKDAAIGAGSLFYSYTLDIRYTLNSGTTLTAHKPLYLVVTPTSNGMCKIASSSPWAQTLPTSADGKWYILIGRTYSTYQCSLYPEHPVYMHNGVGVQRVLPQSALANSSAAGLLSPTDKQKIDALKSLANKNSASGSYTPAGNVSAPALTVTPSTTTKYVASSSTGGGSVTPGSSAQCTLPSLTPSIDGDTLVLQWNAGSFTANTPTAVTLPTFSSQKIATGISSATATAPSFTGTQGTVTVS